MPEERPTEDCVFDSKCQRTVVATAWLPMASMPSVIAQAGGSPVKAEPII